MPITTPSQVTNLPNGVSAAFYIGGEYMPPTVVSVDGAIPVTPGSYAITKGSAAALTLIAPIAGAPSAGGDDGVCIYVYSETAFAHVITCASVGFNGKAASGTATWGAAKGNGLALIARNGQWWVMAGSNTGVTIA